MMKDSSNRIVANPHWCWHVLIVVCILLLVTAAMVPIDAADDQPLPRAHQRLFVIACIVVALSCLVLWASRSILSRDWHTALARQSLCPALLPRDIIPSVRPTLLQAGLWVALVGWMGWVAWTLTVDDHLAATLTLENGLLQDLTVLCYAAASLIFFGLLIRTLIPMARAGLGRWWLIVLMLGCLGVAGEEINWGQSVLRFETPEFLARTNIQQEVSLHNLELPGLPGRHWSNDVLLLIAFVGGVVLPVLVVTSQRVRHLIWTAEIPVPPWLSQAYFLAAAGIPRDGNMLGRLSRDNIPSELREVTIACAMLIWAWALWRSRQEPTPADFAGHTLRDGESGETRIQQA